jgi:ergothioneine biosynthesis protein EgtB
MVRTATAARSQEALGDLYIRVRRCTEELCAPLKTEDFVVQTLPDVSPTKWHLAHTSWFFETFVLKRAVSSYPPFHQSYGYLFNSYYHAAGGRHPQAQRGLLSRPTVEEVFEYRRHVDRWMTQWLEQSSQCISNEIGFAVELGLNHEEQHQELLLTDIKHVLGSNPLEPVYRRTFQSQASPESRLRWISFDEGVMKCGHAGDGFAFDNEAPRHAVYLEAFELANRPVSCGEYVQFINDGGYRRPELWLSDGWDTCQREGWRAPLYWKQAGNDWALMTLSGRRKVDPREPVCHVSYYEADAFARWAGARLPREEEWELAATGQGVRGNFLESGRFHPAPGAAFTGSKPQQLFGDVWEWTSSPYLAYPGYTPFAGAFGEYNGKFMSNRMVLRGGSCVTPIRHIRPTYRNFFPPAARWQFSGLRLARSRNPPLLRPLERDNEVDP